MFMNNTLTSAIHIQAGWAGSCLRLFAATF